MAVMLVRLALGKKLRRYAEECWEMVYYAVPPERLA